MAPILYIKNMVCARCIEAVSQVMRQLDLAPTAITLGEVQLASPLTPTQKKSVSAALISKGFQLLEDKNSQIIGQIKTLVIESIHYPTQRLKTNYSTYLEEKIGKDYHALSTLFSSVEGITIERFVILQKLERIKELLMYDEMTLSQVAHAMDYSSVQHLSNQFKKNTGMTPSEFKKLRSLDRNPLDRVH